MRGRGRADVAGNIGLDRPDVVRARRQRDIQAERAACHRGGAQALAGVHHAVVVGIVEQRDGRPVLARAADRQRRGVLGDVVGADRRPVSSAAARSSAVGARAVVSTVMSSACVVEAALTLPATSVWIARTLCVPAASETSRLNAPPATVTVPRLSPASTTPLLLASSNSVTRRPVLARAADRQRRCVLGDVVGVWPCARCRPPPPDRAQSVQPAPCVDRDVERMRGRGRADVARDIGLDRPDVVRRRAAPARYPVLNVPPPPSPCPGSRRSRPRHCCWRRRTA